MSDGDISFGGAGNAGDICVAMGIFGFLGGDTCGDGAAGADTPLGGSLETLRCSKVVKSGLIRR